MGFLSIREFGDIFAVPAHASYKNVIWNQGSIALGVTAESGDRSDEIAESAAILSASDSSLPTRRCEPIHWTFFTDSTATKCGVSELGVDKTAVGCGDRELGVEECSAIPTSEGASCALTSK